MPAIPWSTPLAALDAVALDTETTGLDPRQARVVQLGAVRLDGLVPAPAPFVTLVNPGVPIPPGATAVHGISDLDVAAAPEFATCAAALAAYLGEAVVIGHTLAYDLEVLKREHALAGLAWRAPVALDVRLLAPLAEPRLVHDDLDRLCAAFGIAITGRHTAPGDAMAAAQLFAALVPLLRGRGIRTLAEAQAASRELAVRRAQGELGLPDPVEGADVLARIDSYPYRHRVTEVMSAPPVVVAPDMRLAEVVGVLAERGVSSAFLAMDSGWGIVTERDVLRALAAQGGAALGQTALSVASAPLQTVPAEAFVYRAIGRMGRLGFRHLGVVDAAGTLVGALTPRNLLRQRGSGAILLGDAIDTAASATDLGRAWAQVAPMVAALLAEEVDARTVAEVISAEIRAMTARAAVLAEAAMLAEGHGPPPEPYCVLVLGSAGRGESLLAADQDNAIVFAEGEPDSPADRWFAGLGSRMNDILDAAGVARCKGGVMAGNPSWRHSLAGWRATCAGWLRRQRPEDLLNVDIFFDAVPVHGARGLGETVLAEAWRAAHAAPDFIKLMAVEAARGGAPLGLLAGLTGGRLGGLRRDAGRRTDLKRGGLLPIVAAARALALRHNVVERSTPGRLRGVSVSGLVAPSDVEALAAAHHVVLRAVLAQQLADSTAGIALSTLVDTERLARADRAALFDALGQVGLASALLREGLA